MPKNNEETYYIAALAEECAEVTQICMKMLRFGIDSDYTGESNKDALNREVTDLLGVLVSLHDKFNIIKVPNEQGIGAKVKKLEKYYVD